MQRNKLLGSVSVYHSSLGTSIMATPAPGPSSGPGRPDGAAPAPSGATPSEVAAEVPFRDLCSLMEKVQKMSGLEKKKKVLGSFLEKWREEHQRLHQTDAATTKDTFHPAMRLLLPHVDRARPAYGLKEVALARQYIDILNIAKESTDAQKLLHYRAPQNAKQKTDVGDFAAVAYFVLKNRCPEKGSLTLVEVNEYLDNLAQSNLGKDRPGVKKALQLLLRNTSALEQKWLIRIILKELKMGLSESSVFSVFHPNASELFTVCNSLEKVCSDLRDPKTRLNEAAITYFTPFRPMLGQKASIDEVVKLMDNGPFYLETKFDGDRIQLHRQDKTYRYFSRSSKDYTSSFGSGPYQGSFTPMIHDAFNSKVTSCILDGEMVGWDSETETFRPKGDHVDVKTVGQDEESGIQQCFVVFDVLMINDVNLSNCPLHDRVEQLKKVFQPVRGYMHLVDRREATTKEEIVVALNEAIDRREEGLVVKNPSSVYCPDKRKGSGWIKIKPEYVDSLSDQLDVLIIGGYYGEGRRAGMVSHFLCGVAVTPDLHGDKKPQHYKSFCKVGSGYTLSELRDLGLKLKPHWQKFDSRKLPNSLLFTSGHRERPDLWIPPSKSCIVQIKAAEIVTSERYRTGCTLRFPRVEKVRTDKEYYDCMTTDELEQLKNMASGRLAHSHYDSGGGGGEDGSPAKKKRRTVASRVERPKGVAAHFRPVDASEIQEVSTLFGGKEFCVVNGSSDFTKSDMEKKIIENGGCLVQNPGSETFVVLVGRLIVRANNIISTGLYDVVRPLWLMECLDSQQFLPFEPRHMLSARPTTTAQFSELYDQYGDSYMEDVTEEGLREVFKRVTEKSGERLRVSQQEMAEIESRYFPNTSSRGLFRQCRVYLDRYVEINNPETAIKESTLELTELELRLHGGEVAEDFDDGVTHVIFDTNDLSRVPELRRMERRRARKHHFVTTEWVQDSIDCQFMKNERPYEPIVN